jgi:hypothetical protein
MKKVLIISYFFPPSNFVGGKRVSEWTKRLNSCGIYPVVVTRQWSENQKDIVNTQSILKEECEKGETYEVHRLPSKKSLRDYCAQHVLLRPFQKILTAWELIMSNFFISSLSYGNFYEFCLKYIKENKDVHVVIASGRPFQSFHIGHKLKKEFPSLKWCPDYRDQWSTHERYESVSLFSKLIWKLEGLSELRWTKNADFFLSVSQTWVNRIKSYIGVDGYEIINGFDSYPEIQPSTSSLNLTICYAGTLYDSQNIEVFINAVNNMISAGNTDITVLFVGVEMNPGQKERVLKLTAQHADNYKIMNRVPSYELGKIKEKADLFFLSSFSGTKGWYPVKLFDYFQTGKGILLCPSDHDVMESFIKKTNSGFIANNIEQCQKILNLCLEKKKRGEPISFNINRKEAEKYSRSIQVQKLGKILTED